MAVCYCLKKNKKKGKATVIGYSSGVSTCLDYVNPSASSHLQ